MTPLLLTIQTASPAGSVALTAGDHLLAEYNLDLLKTPTEWLLKSIADLLEMADVKQADLDAIAVVLGPGSFTGLRVGLATAKGLSLAAGCPLLGISSLRCLAMQVPFADLPVCAMLDARKQEVYAATYRWQGGAPQPVTAETVSPPEQLLAGIKGEVLFAGNGAQVYRTLIVRQLGDRAHFAPAFVNLPRAAGAAALAVRDWEAGRTFSADELMPNYLRPAEAELNLQKKKK